MYNHPTTRKSYYQLTVRAMSYGFNISMEEEDSKFAHKVYKNDPILFTNYVGKEVKIMMKDKSSHSGIVYTVDPVSGSIVLLQSGKTTQYRLQIIFDHAIQNMKITSEEKINIPELFPSISAKFSPATITTRKNIVMKLLQDNRFPVKEEDNVLQIEDTLSIEPPYYPENCNCTNSIILTRIQNILRRVNDVE
ncbi:gem-associated protein 6-like [Linepithema humile]|uniref:gem-associated protein 6-like n=1 Tax=Linepithema humile TaxID=83485 RepID=UPI00062359FF|nr:PREDICTED: gem-associated protein 6-like [Linepithema humile]